MLFDDNQNANLNPRPKRAPEVTPEDFFKVAQPHSILKSEIVSKYIIGWANIIVRGLIKYNKDAKVYVVDLFSGPGQYEDGTKSTPLKVIEQALKDSDLIKNVIFRFNDNSSEMIARLQGSVDAIVGANSFRYPIKYTTLDAESEEVASWFSRNASGKQLPMLVFIDPFGYKQISRELLKNMIRVPKSDILFFFNYKRINAALDNKQEHFTSNMNKIFGEERVQIIKAELDRAKPRERENIILNHLTESLKEIGAVHVAPFGVVQEDAENTSHYIVGITKHPKGYELLKKVMRQHSEIGEQGQAFGYNPASKARESQPSLFGAQPDRIDLLASRLSQEYKGRAMLFEQLYKTHHPKTEYTEAEYKHAVRRLLSSGRAYNPDEDAVPPRKTAKGEQAVPGHFKIKFT